MKKISTRNSASGILHKYKNPDYIDKERDAFINALLERHNMAKEITIELTRESFCMGDDATAPNAEKFVWRDSDRYPEIEINSIVEKYLGTNLPGFAWRGFADGKKIMDVIVHRERLSFSREIKLVENWQELLRETRHIHFVNAETTGELPETYKALILKEGK